MNTQKILDRIISDSILTDKILPNHKLYKMDYTLCMDNGRILYFNNITLTYKQVDGDFFIKTTYFYNDTITKEPCHKDTFFKLINIKRKNFLRNLAYNLINKKQVSLIKSEKLNSYNIAMKQGKLQGYTHLGEIFWLYIEHIKPEYLDEFLPIEISFATSEMSTMSQKYIAKFLISNVL